MYVIDFEFADKKLSDFDCIPCHINSNTGMSETDIGCDITFNTVKNNHSSIQYKTSTSYDNVYTTTFEIMKNPCGKTTQEDIHMTYDEVRVLIKWLNRREYKKLKFVTSENEVPDVCYYGSFNVKQIVINDNIIGLSVTFTSNAPYGFGERIQLTYDISSAGEYFYIHGDGDEIGILYPNVSITCLQEGNLEIKNTTTGTVVEIENCLENEVIYISGEHKFITSNKKNEHSTIYDDFKYEFLDILISDNEISENEYQVSLPCKITIDYSPIRKVGVN